MSPSPLCARKLETSLVRHVGLAPLFKAQAQLLGPATAIESDKHAISYEELHVKALQLAQLIRLATSEPETPIAIVIPRGVNHILAQIAIVYAGGACVPLDMKQPDVFLRRLLENLEVKLALVDDENWDRALEIDKILVDHTLNSELSDKNFEVSSNGPSSCSHILHTSGTTGDPKAAQILAGGIINLAFNSTTPFEDHQRLAHIGNTVFDITLYEIWVCLLRGGTMVVYPHKTVIDPVLFSQSPSGPNRGCVRHYCIAKHNCQHLPESIFHCPHSTNRWRNDQRAGDSEDIRSWPPRASSSHVRADRMHCVRNRARSHCSRYSQWSHSAREAN